MGDIEKRAWELLAAEYERSKFRSYACEIRNSHGEWGEEIRAIIAALTPPEGYVLVPSVLIDCVKAVVDADSAEADARALANLTAVLLVIDSSIRSEARSKRLAAMLATRPEVP